MRTIKMFPIHRDDWAYVVDKTSAALVWCIQDISVDDGSLQGVLCFGSKANGTDVGIDFIKLYDTETETLADISTESLSGISVPRQVSWAALAMDWRGIYYKEKFRCLMGGQGWSAQSLTWSPGYGDIVSDPYTMAMGLKLNGIIATVNGAVILGSDCVQALFIAQDNDCAVHDDVQWVCKPLFEWSLEFEHCQLLQSTCNLRTALLANTWFVDKCMADPEDVLIEKMNVKNRK